MKIKSFGCSFIYGSDLSDNPCIWNYSRLTWPALLSQAHGCEYECFARPGSGNLQIAERVLNECATATAEDFFIIDWTWIDRFDIIKSLDPWQPWETLLPNTTDLCSNFYYKNLHAEHSDKLRTLLYIKAVLDTLVEKKLKFIMTYEDSLIFDKQWNTNMAIKLLQNAVEPHMTTFEGKSFLSWSRANGFPESLKWHPLEPAHQAACNYMIKIFDKQKTNDPAQQALV